MADISDYIIPRGWRTREWSVDQEGPIPSHGFPVGGILLIGAVPGAPAFDLHWLDENGQPCQIKGIPFQQDGSLYAENISASFGGTSLTLKTVSFSIDSEGLHGTLSEGLSDGNTGTYAADANPPVQEPPRVRVEELASA
jgi:hypothetical protein